MCFAKFSLAVDRRKSGEQSADFISCAAFGKTAETMEKYVFKGTKLCVEGHIQTGSYTDKEGRKVYTTDVIVDNFDFAESKGASTQTSTQQEKADDNGFMQVPDGLEEELPFT
jgi:single-strand DNA-binding protein